MTLLHHVKMIIQKWHTI